MAEELLDNSSRSYSLANLFVFVTACALFAMLARSVLTEIKASRSSNVQLGARVKTPINPQADYPGLRFTCAMLGAGLAHFVAGRLIKSRSVVVVATIMGWLLGSGIGLALVQSFAAAQSPARSAAVAGHVPVEVMFIFAGIGGLLGLSIGIAVAIRIGRYLRTIPLGMFAGTTTGILAGAQICAPANLLTVSSASALLVFMAVLSSQAPQSA